MTKLDLAHLSMRQTTVTKGAKSAKGMDPIEGTVMQFSSLMSVMNEDHSLMNAMQREYVSEKSEVPVPEAFRDREPVEEVDPAVPIEEDIEFDVSDLVPNFAEKEEPQKDVLSGEELVSLPEVFSDPTINLYSIDDVSTITPVELSPEEAVPVFQETTLTNTVLIPDAIEAFEPATPVEVEVPDLELAKLEIVDEVLKTVDVPDDVLPEELVVESEDTDSNDFGLRDLLKREVFSAEEIVLDEEPVVEDVDTAVTTPLERLVRTPKIDTDDEELPVEDLDISVEPIELSTVGATLASAISGSSAAAGQATVVNTSSEVNISNLQDKREKEELPKMPKNLRHQSHFSELLEAADDEALEKLSFNRKLLRRLELIVNDPAGKLDVEIAQDPVGVHVKAIVPTEVLKSMEGLQQDLQIALYQKGLELGSFEMQERGDSIHSGSLTSNIDDINSEAGSEKIEEMAAGGILVNQRV